MSGQFSVGGLASGLDTNSIISQLMQLERVPIQRLTMRQAVLNRQSESWSTVLGKLSAVRSATNNIRTVAQFEKFSSATSSDEDVLTVSVTGTPSLGAVDLTVEALAYAEQRASNDNFASADATMGTRTLDITTSSGTYAITPDSADMTITDFAAKINSNVDEVRAQVVQIDSGEYELVIKAKDTGLENTFSVVATNWTSAWTETQAAADAEVRMGDPVNGLLVTRSSNTIDDLVEGVTINLRQVSAAPVTVTTARNIDAAVAKVGKWVTEMNALLQTAKDLSKYDAEKKQAQSLTGDATLRALTGDVIKAVTDAVTGLTGDYSTAGSVGIETTRDGLLTLDESVLREALADDFEAVANVFARTGTTTDTRLSYISASDATQPGTYAVSVTTAAEVAEVTGSAYAASAETMTITSGLLEAEVIFDGTETLAQALTKINDALEDAGITTITAEDDGGAIRLFESRYGSAVEFSVDSTGTGFGLKSATPYEGIDVVATVAGTSYTGKGQTLTVDDEGEDHDGLVMRITATAADVAGAGGTLSLSNLVYTTGLAGRVSQRIADYEGTEGRINILRDGLKAQVDEYDDQIEQMEVRLKVKEASLVRQFAAMEQMMGRLTSQSNWLAAQIGAMGANSK
jgi:flagellar hook-associated protein 2